MKRRTQQRGGVFIPALAACFGIGILVGWWLRSGAPMPAVSQTAPAGSVIADPAADPKGWTAGPNRLRASGASATLAEARRQIARAEAEGPSLHPEVTVTAGEVAATTGEPLIAPASPTSLPVASAIGELRRHGLRLPIDDADAEAMKGGFEEGRDAGRPHEAVDILAERNTPIRAVEDGSIAKLFESKAGGTTIYQFDPSGRFCYYYAHLERYAPGLHDGQHVSQGEVIGFVGTSGNAPPNTPHLHFAVFELDADRHWWKGRAIDPYLIFRE
ncbi:MAG TPA: peptidoglycan DD-metalloendopeptidase family protein [Roseiarcus sp.]|nr:peptidoglycan DD-metalloendopeptidase family protein [Roseiarcus sp.]